jgi:MFS family permease
MYYGWRIVATCFAILFVIVGMVYYSFPVFYAPLIEEFHWSRAAVTAGFAISIIFVGPLFGVSAGFLIDRYGTRRILLAGLICAGSAFLGFSLMQALWMFYLFYFLQTIGYVSAGPVPNQVLVSHWFVRRRGRAMGVAYVGIGIGGAVAPVLTQFLITHFGWRRAMLVISGMVVIVLLPLTIAWVKNRPAELGLQPDGDPHTALPTTESSAESLPISLRQAARERSFWMILIGSFLSIGAVGGVIQHLVLYLRDQRFSAEAAAQVASFLLVASILGRLMMGYLADRFPKKYVMLAACVMVAAAIPLLYFATRLGAVYLFALIFGFGMGADYMLIPLMTAQCFGLASLGRLMGVILTTDSLGQALAPVVVGRIYDLTHSYNWAFVLLSVMAGLGAVAVALIPMARRSAESRASEVPLATSELE